MSNHSLKKDVGHEGGRGGRTKVGRCGRIESQSVFDQLGDGSGGRNLGEQREIRTGTWSEPVEGRGVSHLSKARARWELVKAKSSTEGLAMCVKGKPVYTPGWLRREKL